MNIILKTDLVVNAIFHVEHIMSSTHISMWQCSAPLSRARRSSFFYSDKKVSSLSLILLAQ